MAFHTAIQATIGCTIGVFGFMASSRLAKAAYQANIISFVSMPLIASTIATSIGSSSMAIITETPARLCLAFPILIATATDGCIAAKKLFLGDHDFKPAVVSGVVAGMATTTTILVVGGSGLLIGITALAAGSCASYVIAKNKIKSYTIVNSIY